MLLGRIVFLLVIHAAAFGVLAALWPRLQSRRAALVFTLLALVGLSAWLLPMALGLGISGVLPVVGAPLKLLGSFWIIAALGITLGGGIFFTARTVARVAAAGLRRMRSKTPDEVDPGRRRFLTGMGRAVPVAAVVTSGGGVAAGSAGFTIKREEIRLPRLPKALDGFRIGQITDLHVGAFIDPSFLASTVDAMNAEKVELQVMTGDLIDDVSQLEETIAALERSSAPHGLYAVLGNHEYWRGLAPILAAYEASARKGSNLRLRPPDPGGERVERG